MRQPKLIPNRLREFRALVESVDPDIIHSHFVGTTLTMRMALGRNHRIPRVFQVPGPLHLEHPFFRHAEFRTAGTADYWIGSCRWTCQRYLSLGASPSRVFLSYYGLDFDDFEIAAPGFLRSTLSIPQETKIVGMVALMYPPKRYLGQRRGLKGHEDLIDALKICIDRGADIVGVFVGGASIPGHPYERQVYEYAQEQLGDRALLLGTRQDVPKLYPDFDLAVHPSHSENVGGAGESLLLGIPTIATEVGGLPDAVRPGETGWLVPSKDPVQLAAAIEEALADLEHARRLARNGERLMRQMVDVKNNVTEVLDAYQSILAQRGVKV
jgi:glycosyltransferase involved in cell wall biosynthesis